MTLAWRIVRALGPWLWIALVGIGLEAGFVAHLAEALWLSMWSIGDAKWLSPTDYLNWTDYARLAGGIALTHIARYGTRAW